MTLATIIECDVTSGTRPMPLIAKVAVWIVAFIVSLAELVLDGTDPISVIIFLGLIIIGAILISRFADQYQRAMNYRSQVLFPKLSEVNRALATIGEYEPGWNREMMKDLCEDSFFRIMAAWTQRDREVLKGLLHWDLFFSLSPYLDRLDQLGETHVIKDLTIKEIDIVNIHDVTDDLEDSFVARIVFEVEDYTMNRFGRWTEPSWIKEIDPNQYGKRNNFCEYWTFSWQEAGCMVMKIEGQISGEVHVREKVVLEDAKYMDMPQEGVKEKG